MKYVLTDAHGKRLGVPTSDRLELRAAGKAHVLNKGGMVMAWFADDKGNITRYSPEDTFSIRRDVIRARGSLPNAGVAEA